MSQNKLIYVVLSRSNTVLSRLIHSTMHDAFTHAAISLDSSLEYMFSFGRRHPHNPFIGCFKREHLSEGIYETQSNIPGLIIELSVTAEQYYFIKSLIGYFLLNNHKFGYNYRGLFGHLWGMNGRSKNRFMCSEFVYYALKESGVCDFGIPRELVRPQNMLALNGRVIFQGNLKQYAACQLVNSSQQLLF